MLPIAVNSRYQKPKAGQPPELDLQTALARNAKRRTVVHPGRVSSVCGGVFAAFASTVHFGAGLPHEQFGSVVALAFSLGMCGGWILLQAGDAARQRALTREAWSLYHARRAREFRWN